jgi:hypothetical protein
LTAAGQRIQRKIDTLACRYPPSKGKTEKTYANTGRWIYPNWSPNAGMENAKTPA